MPTLLVINENGDQQQVTVTAGNTTIIVEQNNANDFEFQPAVVDRVEYDHEGQMSSITTVCGETENRRESDEKPKMVVEGIVTKDQLPTLKTIKRGDTITLISDVHETDVTVKRVSIEQNSDLVAYIENGNRQLAFRFQMQMREP